VIWLRGAWHGPPLSVIQWLVKINLGTVCVKKTHVLIWDTVARYPSTDWRTVWNLAIPGDRVRVLTRDLLTAKQVHLRDAKLEAERQCSAACSGAYCRCDEGCVCNLRLTEHWAILLRFPEAHETWEAVYNVRCTRGADKSLARPTYHCRKTESIVSLQRGVCSCAELQDFSCYRGWKEACQATRANSATSRLELKSIIFPLQGKAPKEIHAILAETLGEHVPPYAKSKLGGPV
jgi:hypothetical protein